MGKTNDERLKNPKQFGEDSFDELLERICAIRASERRLYQKICDIYKTFIDYFVKKIPIWEKAGGLHIEIQF